MRRPVLSARRWRELSWRRRLSRVAVLLVLILMPVAGPITAVGVAGGFDCKEVPKPEFPDEPTAVTFDGSSADRAPVEQGTGYETYGWAGLRWYTYDLGCGADITRAPDAVADTALGNQFMSAATSVLGAAFWLDDQTRTEARVDGGSSTPLMAQFDNIVLTVTETLGGVYKQWIGLALTALAAVVLWHSMRSNPAGVTRAAALGMAGLTLGALMIGVPSKAIEVADNTLGTLITDTYDEMMSVSINGEGETLKKGATDPRNVLLDRILLEDWRKGWFGTNFNDRNIHLGPKLRHALAFSYDELQQIEAARESDPFPQDPEKSEAQRLTNQLVEQKKDIFENEVLPTIEKLGISYQVFQGKESGRTGIGFLAFLKVAMPSLLWIGASLMKITALIAIRLAILSAPFWVPLGMVQGGLYNRVGQILMSAYLWAVAASVIFGVYLIVLVRLYTDDSNAIDGTWRLWFMIVLTLVCWIVLRPFKRMGQTLAQNHAGLLNRGARKTQSAMKKSLLLGATGGMSTATGVYSAAKLGISKWRNRRARDEEGEAEAQEAPQDAGFPAVAPQRPEGRDLVKHRARAYQQGASPVSLTKSAVSLTKQPEGTPGLSRLERMSLSKAAYDNTAPAGSPAARGRLQDEQVPAGAPDRTSTTTPGDVSSSQVEAPVRANTPARWDGGPHSAIAPMRLYTPRQNTDGITGRRAARPVIPRRTVQLAGTGASGPMSSRVERLAPARPESGREGRF